MISLIFVGVFAAIVGAYWAFVVMPEQRGQVAVRRRLRWEDPVQSGVQLLKKQQVLSTIATLNVLLKRLDGVSGPLKELIDQAGVGLTVGSFLLLTSATFMENGLTASMSP